MDEGFVREGKGGVLLNLRVSPRAGNTSIEGMHGDGALKVRVAAPPVDGKANAEVERFLAGVFGISPSRVEIVRGASGRDKVVLLRGIEAADVRRRISGMKP